MNCTCKRCSNKLIVGRDPIMIVNPDIEGSAYFLCEACSEKEYEEGNIIKCVACGNLYDQDVAPVTDEKTEFRPCPSCGLDVDEGLSKDDFDDLRFFQKFAVIVQFGNGRKRGYMISAKNVQGMMEKLMEHVQLDYDCTISYSAILLDEDVIE